MRLFFKMQYLLELSLSKLCFYNYTYLELVISCCLFLFENDFNIMQKILISFDTNHSSGLLGLHLEWGINFFLKMLELLKGIFGVFFPFPNAIVLLLLFIAIVIAIIIVIVINY